MKSLISILFFIVIFIDSSLSQDIILKNNGEEILSKVTEVTKNEVKYKIFNNLDGPIYILEKNDIFMIKYENGIKEIINSSGVNIQNNLSIKPGLFSKHYNNSSIISKSEFRQIIKSNGVAYQEYELGKDITTYSFILGIPSGFALGFQLGKLMNEDILGESNYNVLLLSGVGALAATVGQFIGYSKMVNSTKIFNNNNNSFGFSATFSTNGIGFIYKIN